MASWTTLIAGLAGRTLREPRLAADLTRVAWRFRRRGWWHRFPFVPLPAREYVRWRMYTAYADERHVPSADEIARYARWAARRP
jgi:hypothetical protein